MSSCIYYACGPDDDRALIDFIKSIGIYIVPAIITMPVNEADPSVGPLLYLSPVPLSELHPVGNPPIKIKSPCDPVLMFARSYYQKPYLILGDIEFYTDTSKYIHLTKPIYQKITRWIRKNWIKPDGDFCYYGPHAMRLIEEEGAQAISDIPGTVEHKIITIPYRADEI